MTPPTPSHAPGEQEPDDHSCSEPVGDDNLVICQEATGKDTVIGGGEFPDKDRKPDDAAPGGDPETGSTHKDIAESLTGPPPEGTDPMAGEAPTG
jgi:hypothetical protein